MNIPYWQQQTPAKPLYPDIAWNKPQQRAQAGKLGIIGGNRLSFRAIEHSYTTALATGVGQARVVLPDALRGTIPASVTDTIFAASNGSGSCKPSLAGPTHSSSLATLAATVRLPLFMKSS